jgi:hypothetical protein
MAKKNTSNISVINLAQYEAPKVTETTRDEWVEYGEKNSYFDWLIERFKNSTTNNSVITNISRLIYGRGIDALDSNKKPNEYAMLKGMISPKALKGIATNFKMLGNAYFQVSYNKNHTRILKVDYINTKLIRVGKCNDKGEIDSFFFSNDWSDIRRNEPTKYSAFGTSKDAIEIYCLKFDSVDMKYYSEPDYLGAIKYAILEEEIADFLVTDVQQSFSGQKVINFNNGVGTPETREIIERSVRQRLQGAKGDKVIVAFNENKEMATTIDDIALTDAPEHYAYLATEAQSKLLNAHGVVSPMIVGITTENSGFSSNADEIAMATKVFYNQSIVPFQEAIIDALDEFLAFNNASLKLYFKRLNLMDSIEEKQQEREEANLKMSSDFDSIIAEFGEKESDEWELIDSREVDYDAEVDLDSQVIEWEKSLKDKPTTLSKVLNFVSTGTARGNAKSSQDKEVDGFYFKVRYKYVGNANPERGFCKAMMRADKTYRKEDLAQMGSRVVNAGFGEFGADTYDIFKFKGGPRCHHKWQRLTFVSTTRSTDVNSPNANTVSTGKARKFGYRVTNPKEVAMKPNDMKHKGFSPNNNNRPTDAR